MAPSTDNDPQVSTGKTKSLPDRLRELTPMLAFMTLYLSSAAFNFGYDQGIVKETKLNFDQQFGEWDPKSRSYVIPSYLQSIMTSTPYLGKLLGCWIATPITERIGRKKMMLIIAILSYIGVSLQISATTAAQFTVGRIVCFFMAGFTVSIVPVYLGECSPPALRGLVGTQLQLQITLSVMIAAFINYGVSNYDSPVQWKITLAIAYLMPTIICGLWYRVQESPRWLVSQSRRSEAVASLRYFRKGNVPTEAIEAEIDLIAELGNEGKGTWKEVFSKENRLRTGIACFVMLGQQITGQVFSSQYGTFFYKQQGIPNPFLIQSLSTIVGLLTLCVTSLIIDGFGRRAVLLIGGFLQAIFMFCLGGVGLIPNLSTSLKYLMVVFIILDGAAYNMSWAPLSYLTIGEVSNSRVREKTAMLAVSVSIVTAFIVSFTLPYLMNAPYANLGPKVGFIYGSCALIMAVVAFFLVPELKGRTLEEVDELFASGISMRQFKHAVVQATETSNANSAKLIVPTASRKADEGGVATVEHV
ncbi:general substrate transporter [Thozetella sp. PMI_491]|nr:general substrate transporter [Thozetella sp. PMI_491]